MTARQLSRQPCPVCKTDTLHHVMKCSDCGHVNETNYEASQRMKKARVGRLLARGVASASVGYYLRKPFIAANSLRRADIAASPDINTPRILPKGGPFGRGRTRTKA
jgi:hypothetical protein